MNEHLNNIFSTPLYVGSDDDIEFREKVCNLLYDWRESVIQESDNSTGLMSYHWDLKTESNQVKDFDKFGITTFNSGNLTSDPKWHFVGQHIINAAYKLFNKDCNLNIDITNLWATIYPNKSYVPEHIHNNSLYSGVFYVNTSANCGNIVFKDPSYIAKSMSSMMNNSFPSVDTVYTQEVSDGLMVLFPSWLPHSTQPNDSEEDRIIISFNLDFY